MIDVAQNPSDAVEKALDLFGNDILRFAFSYMKNREDAEDVLQETLIRLMQAQPVFENEQKLKSWLLRVAANLCLDQLRSAVRKREVAMPEGFDMPVAESAEQQNSAVLQQIFNLPDKYRSVIHLYYYEEYSTREIAGITGQKEATVRSLLKRGREKLEKIMKGENGHAAGI